MNPVAITHPNEHVRNAVKVEWNIGRRCNFDCSYCDDFTHDNKSPHLTFEVMRDTVDKLVDGYPGKDLRISITGGEPTVNPAFLDVVRHMKARGVSYVSVTTNGSRTTDYYVDAMQWLDNIVFSYHMEYHRRAKIVDSILAVKTYIDRFNEENKERWEKSRSDSDRKRMHVHIMMLPGSFTEAEEVMKACSDNGILYALRRIRPSYDKDGSGRIVRPFEASGTLKFRTDGGGPDYSDDYGYYTNEELDYLSQHATISNFKNVSVWRQGEDGTIVKEDGNVNEITSAKENRYRGWLCWAGHESLWIGADGKVAIATCRGRYLGNIHTGFDLPSEPVRCPKEWCVCAADLNTTKIQDATFLGLVGK